MEDHYLLTDTEFEKQFESCTLSPALFTHEAHLRLTWIHLTKYGLEKALETIVNQIINFIDHIGVRNKYNHTVTIAAIRAVWHFRCKSTSDNFSDFISEFPRLKYNFRDLIAAHYSVNIFDLHEAKHAYLEPDLLSFD